MKRVLFTTPYGPGPNYFQTLSPNRFFRINVPSLPFGLRFLKENIPELETLEFPSWQHFVSSLANVDTLGISFFMREEPRVVEMIQAARNAGVKNIIGGGFGVLCQRVQPLFDELFFGHAENAIAEKFFQTTLDKVKHPVLVSSVGLPGIPLKKYAFLFPVRGCRGKCIFCQTPAFVPEVTTLPIESIDDVLAAYKRNKIHTVMIVNENFNPDHPYSREVIALLKKYGFEWGCMTRLDLLADRVEYLRTTGFSSCIVGLESLNQTSLDFIKKKEKTGSSLATISELRRNRVTIHVTFMVGYPDDDADAVKQDLNNLIDLDFQTCQIFILTPFPHTPLWELFSEKYGIFEQDYSKFDGFHLVWNHPRIDPETMRALVRQGYQNIYSRKRFLKHLLQPIIRKFA
ncbi:radical SAM protein [bacterium]|nr:radical SAM protein [bacterium]